MHSRPYATDRFIIALACLWAACTFIWTACVGFRLRTHGVTASDPYAYAQMAVDLAQHGTLQHRFHLYPVAQRLNIPTWPVVHVGYHIPTNEPGLSASVWPPGASIILAATFSLFGEPALYLTMPLLALLCLLAVGLLADEFARGETRAIRLFNAACAIFITATSYRQIESVVVPLADIPAQLLTLLALWSAWRGVQRGHSLKYAALTGLTFGLAYLMRYTQLLLAVPILALALIAPSSPMASPARKGRWIAVLGGVACIAGALDLAYHQTAFGNPFIPGGIAELGKFQLENVPSIFLSINRDFWRTNEFGYIAPFLLLGVAFAWRRNREILLYLGSAFCLVVGFHLPYRILLIRDLLPMLPLASIIAGYGMTILLRHSLKNRYKMAVVLLVITATLTLRTRYTIRLPFQGEFATFGYVTQEQRAAFGQLDDLLPPDAIVGASLNSGAIELYTGRPAFRPAFWTAGQMAAFFDDRLNAGVPVFLLLDGTELEPAMASIQSAYGVQLVNTLAVPYFRRDNAIDRPVGLYRVTLIKG